MEIIVATIKDLNRFLNLGLYILLDSERICLMSLSLGSTMRSFPATTSLELFTLKIPNMENNKKRALIQIIWHAINSIISLFIGSSL